MTNKKEELIREIQIRIPADGIEALNLSLMALGKMSILLDSVVEVLTKNKLITSDDLVKEMHKREEEAKIKIKELEKQIKISQDKEVKDDISSFREYTG